jgi:ABC-type antimicrobial peptide transport system permease subunit
VKGNASTQIGGTGGGFIHKRTIDALVETGFIKDMMVEAAAEAIVYPMKADMLQPNRAVKDIFLRGFDRPNSFFTGAGKNITIEYAGGRNEALFTEAFLTEEELLHGSGPLAVLPDSLMERLDAGLGDKVAITSDNKPYIFTVAGRYFGQISGSTGVETILMPLSVLTLLKLGDPLYITAEFTIDSAKNRDLASFREKANGMIQTSGAGVTDLTLLLWDDELIKVVEPLEKNIELLAILYPVTVTVSALIAMVLSLLLVLQRSKEASVMRVLGVTKPCARITLTLEQIVLCLAGLGIGLCLLTPLRGDIGVAIPGSIVLCACAYFTGTLLGAIMGAVFATKSNPLELLQIKE